MDVSALVARIRGKARTGQALALLVAATAAQRWVPMQRWSRIIGVPRPTPEEWRGRRVVAVRQGSGSVTERTVAASVRRASRALPWEPTCLAQATAAQIMLRRRGTSGVLVIGLRAGDDQWDAHAWLLGTRGALTGGPAATGFTPTTVFEVPGRLRAAEVDLQ
jgi:hypothetical protein